jgi:hypothetical protein
MSFGRVLTSAGPLDREVTLAGPATAVREVSPSAAALEPSPWPIDVLASPAARSTADAAVAAVLAQRVWAPAPDRRAQLVLLDAGGFPMNPGVAPSVMSAVSTAGPVRVAWMADAIARITRDADLQAAARRVPSGVSDSRFTATPWQLVAEAANGEPLVCAASAGPRILVLSAASAANVLTPILMRAIANALATMPDLQRAEVVPIADEVLRPWSRPAVPPATPRINTVDDDDRRWFWLAALGLLAIEMWMRRTRRDAANESDVARVA